MAALIGLMLGSLRVLWPWPDGVDSTLLEAPGEAAGTALILAVAGFAVVVIIDLVSKSVGGPSHDEEVSELTS
jgi:putative membrane protein